MESATSQIKDTKSSLERAPTLPSWLSVTLFNFANLAYYTTGESGLGKTTFINTLFTTTLREYKKPEQRHSEQLNRTVNIDLVRADIHEKGKITTHIELNRVE